MWTIHNADPESLEALLACSLTPLHKNQVLDQLALEKIYEELLGKL